MVYIIVYYCYLFKLNFLFGKLKKKEEALKMAQWECLDILKLVLQIPLEEVSLLEGIHISFLVSLRCK